MPLRFRPSPVARVVTVTASVGIAAATAVALTPWVYRARIHATPAWTAVVLVLAAVGELAYVRMRHGGSSEDLTFYEAVVVAGVLLLPPTEALLVPIVALLLASAAMRRSLVKTVFNVGSYALSTAAMVAIYMAIAGTQQPFSILSVVAALVAVAAFAALNLVALTAVLAAAEGGSFRAMLTAEWRLSAFMAMGNVALGAVAVALAMKTPTLLPFAALPAFTLGYAYRAAARGADERQRSAHLLALGGVLAGGCAPQQLLEEVVVTVQRAFDATSVRALVPMREWAAAAVDERREAARVAVGETVIEADAGDDVGVVALRIVLGVPSAVPASQPWRRRARKLTEGEHALLMSITRTLASALATAVHAAALKEETAKLASVVESASDGIVVIDGEGAVVLWSPAMEAMTGRSARDVGACADPGQPLAGLANALGASRVEALPPSNLLHALSPEQPCAAAQFTVPRADEDRQLRASISAIFDAAGTLVKIVAIVHDVTADERLARLKGDFVATVSHELRTPITPIKGYARLLATRGDAMEPEQRARALRTIEERADHLSRLVDDLLLASKISANGIAGVQLQMAAHDVVRLTREAIVTIPGLTERVTLSAAAEEIYAHCDPTRATQCLTNLLTNAQKYSDAGTPIEVTVAASAEAVTITVTDAGRGVPAEELDRIFERFHRVEDSMTMTTDGSGLGLFITRELARAMRGDVSVVSQLGVGSSFTLHFQMPHSAASAA